MKKKLIRSFVFILVLFLAAGIWYWFCGGVSHREIQGTIRTESAHIHAHLDERANRIDEKLDRLEDKLDRLLKLAETPPLADRVQSL